MNGFQYKHPASKKPFNFQSVGNNHYNSSTPTKISISIILKKNPPPEEFFSGFPNLIKDSSRFPCLKICWFERIKRLLWYLSETFDEFLKGFKLLRTYRNMPHHPH